jgi:hypothetical protein
MSTPHRATEEQWEVVEICREQGHTPWPTATCLLELRSRVEALERRCEVQLRHLSDLAGLHDRLAGSVRLLEREVVVDQPEPEPSPVATDDKLYNMFSEHRDMGAALRAIYDLGRHHGAQSATPPPPEPPPAPPWWGDGQPKCSSPLVDEVAECITPSGEPLRRGWACDAITEAADWLEKRGNISSAEDLRREAAAWLEAEPET